MEKKSSFCRICAAHCRIDVTFEDGKITKVGGRGDDPVSAGYTCPKGRMLPQLHYHPRRLNYPTLRGATGHQEVSWSVLLDDLAQKLSEIRERFGNDSVAIYSGTGSPLDSAGRVAFSALYEGLSTRSKYSAVTVDCPSKLLVSDLVAGTGAGSPSAKFSVPHGALIAVPDYERVKLLVYIGDNPVVSHGSYHTSARPGVRIREVAKRGEVWVLDVRRTETARLATTHLSPKHGTDYAVLAYAIRQLLESGCDREYIAQYVTGIDRLKCAVAPFDLSTASAISGVEAPVLESFVKSLRKFGRVSIQTGTGISMSPNANITEWLAWALQIVTGSLDRLGGTWFNPGFLSPMPPPMSAAAGLADGNDTDVVDESGPKSRPELRRQWDQYPATALADEILAGNVRALLVVGGSPVTALPNAERVRQAMSTLDVIAVWDILQSPITEIASHVLPVTDQLERADLNYLSAHLMPVPMATYTEAVVPAAFARRPSWWSMAVLADRMGLDSLFPTLDLSVATDEDILRPLFTKDSRIGFDELKAAQTSVLLGGVEVGWIRRCVLPGGRWDSAPQALVEQLKSATSPAGLVLIPRRQLRNMNSVLVDDGVNPPGEVFAEINPIDADRSGISDGDEIVITSPYGSMRATAQVGNGISVGTVSIPHGHAHSNVCNLTSDTEGIDPLTGMVTQNGVPITVNSVKSKSDLARVSQYSA
jgi:anaerobic selenocysteine-containing dehydrogenase